MFSKHLWGGTLLVAGTSIGAGMLALPVVTAEGGFWPSCLIYLFCWAFMTCTGLLFLEICLKLPPNANIVSMAGAYLGRGGIAFAWALYLFLFYCLTVAYISGGGGLLLEWTRLSIPPIAGQAIFILLFAPFVYFGARAVDRINRFLMVGLILSYVAFIVFGLPHVQPALFSHVHWGASLHALPVIFTSFSYQGVIPSLTAYMKRDAKQIRIAIIVGTAITFAVYLLWEFLILGIVPVEGENGLAAARAQGLTAASPLRTHTGVGAVYAIGQCFAFFAITTSFLGVTLGLMDFLADGLKLPKLGWRRVWLACLTFGPPAAIAFIRPGIFIQALIFAGGIGCALLLGFLPTLLAWVSRARSSEPVQLPGGRFILMLLFLFVIIELAFEII